MLNKKFRSIDDITKIKQYSTLPKQVTNCISNDNISFLNTIHSSMDKKLITDAYRNSFKINESFTFKDTLIKWTKDIFLPIIGDFDISAFFFYESPTPISATDATIHADIWDDESIVDKTILIPLSIKPNVDTHTIVFNQHYYHYGAAYAGQVGNKQNFGSTVILPDNYDMIEALDITNEFDKDFYFKYLTHKAYANFHGLTVADVFKWHIGNAIIFDRTQLHCCDHYFNINSRSWFAVWTNKGKF